MSPKELLTLVVVIPFFLFVANIFPQIQILFVVLWVFYLGFDVYSTYIFYLKDPNHFQNNERNKLFVWFTKKFGFKKAALLFPLTIEVPLILFFAFLPLQTLHAYMFPNTPNKPHCLHNNRVWHISHRAPPSRTQKHPPQQQTNTNNTRL